MDLAIWLPTFFLLGDATSALGDGATSPQLAIWLAGLCVLGIVTLGLLTAFVSGCDKV